jgi:hypothetical protein
MLFYVLNMFKTIGYTKKILFYFHPGVVSCKVLYRLIREGVILRHERHSPPIASQTE